MRNLKKVLSLALALVMLLGMMVVGAGAATTTSANNLTEANEEAIAVLKATKVMTNKRYDDPVTRAEAAKMVLTIYNPDLAKGVKNTTDSAYFKDVKNHWAAGYIDLCFSTGIVSGRSKTVFDPNGSVTGYELAKMVMVAMGKTTKYTGSTWTSKVMADVTSLKLGTDAKISNWNKPVTRLQAAQLTFNGLTTPVDGKKTVYVVTAANGTELYRGDDAITASLIGSLNSRPIVPTEDTTNTLAANFGLTQGPKDDGLGHQTKVWNMGDKEICAVSNSATPAAKTFTYQAITDNDLKGLTYADSVEKIVDGKTETAFTAASAAADIKSLGNDSAVVELYKGADGKVNKVIVVNLYAAKVTVNNATATAKRNITVGDASVNAKETEEFVKDEIVLYTKGNYNTTTTKYDIISIEAAPSVAGELTSFTSKAPIKYTVSGTAYELATKVVGTFDDAAMKGVAKGTYYLAPSGKLVYAEGEKAADTNTGNYAVVLGAHVTKANAVWPATGATVTLQVNALLSDGTMGIYTVSNKITVAGVDASMTAEMELKGESSDKVTGLLNAGAAETDANVLAKFAGVYDYTLDGDKIKLNSKVAALTASPTESGVAVVANGSTDNQDEITKTSIVMNPAVGANKPIINNKTVFVLLSADGKAGKMVTGAAALEGTTIQESAAMAVVDVNKGTSSTTLTAKVVFAKATNFLANTPAATGVYAYLNGDYSRTAGKDSDGKYTYTYDAINSEGAAITLTEKDENAAGAGYTAKTAGIYAVNSDGTLGAKYTAVNTGNPLNVTAYSDGTLVTSGDPFSVPENAKIVIAEEGAELKAGMRVYVVKNANVATQADIIFVLNPVPHVHSWEKVNAVTADCDTEGGDAYYHCSEATCEMYNVKKANADGTGENVVWAKDPDNHDSGKTLTWKAAAAGDKTDAGANCTTGNHYQFCDKCGAAVGEGHAEPTQASECQSGCSVCDAKKTEQGW